MPDIGLVTIWLFHHMRLRTIILLLIRFKIGNDKSKDLKIRITHNCLFFTDLYWSHNRSRNRKSRVHAVPWLIPLFLARIEPLLTSLRGSLPKSSPVDFTTKNTCPLFFVGEEALVGIY